MLYEKLWPVFLKVYDPTLTPIQNKDLYRKAVYKLNIAWCSNCTVNNSFREFLFQAEDLSPEQIAEILNPSSTPMAKKKTVAVKKTATKTTVKKAATKTTVKKDKAVITKASLSPEVKVSAKEVVVKDTTLPWGIKFLYIPTRK